MKKLLRITLVVGLLLTSAQHVQAGWGYYLGYLGLGASLGAVPALLSKFVTIPNKKLCGITSLLLGAGFAHWYVTNAHDATLTVSFKKYPKSDDALQNRMTEDKTFRFNSKIATADWLVREIKKHVGNLDLVKFSGAPDNPMKTHEMKELLQATMELLKPVQKS